MTSRIITNGIIRSLLIIIGCVVFSLFLYQIRYVIIYIIIAAVLALIARPVVVFLKNKIKLPNTFAVILTMLCFILLAIGLISMFVPLILKQSENLSLLNTTEFKSDIESLFHEINIYFLNKGINIFDELNDLDLLSNLKNIPNLLNTILGGIGSISIGLLSVLFISFFLMKDNKIIHNSLFVFIPNSKTKRVAKSLEIIKGLLSRYFIGLIFQITILFLIYTTVLLIFGVKNVIVIAFICAFLNLIPFIGPIVGGVLMLLLTMTENLELDFQTKILPTTLYVMLGYMIAQLIDNFISQPMIFSKSVKSHPLEIFLIIITGGFLFGIIGMVIAIPSYTAIKVILKEFLSDNKIVKSLTKDL